jgi:hypothetical protein
MTGYNLAQLNSMSRPIDNIQVQIRQKANLKYILSHSCTRKQKQNKKKHMQMDKILKLCK